MLCRDFSRVLRGTDPNDEVSHERPEFVTDHPLALDRPREVPRHQPRDGGLRGAEPMSFTLRAYVSARLEQPAVAADYETVASNRRTVDDTLHA